ncbi:5'-methylthioadenosine/S-adenosylhomocysteine nucleosidase family protein [Lentzea californiensis]|uniref:5'-methylthioadenosine/S-adenosylhomocysteine nucleosidase family protein n=1 Tax=Lentzea californiensis TaxID=438851 RepID=UPI002166A811|nr:5'-methylthioadenosine/S-adenosylhomocysteine nucleosidase [Lentzea californiensis]MCR3753738.1 adenosylhomocysteine nucleosidase [Lentzea californiensis]
MNTSVNVNGPMFVGGKVRISGSAIGPHASVNAAPGLAGRPELAHQVGVITMTADETRAVRGVLELAPLDDRFHAGERFTRIVAVQTHGQGQGAAMDAAQRLVERFSPKVLVLVGIAGGIDPGQRIGDVVVATKVVGYDLHKETPAGTQRRGRYWEAPATAGHAVGEFFSARGEPAEFHGFVARSGLIGSGNGVIARGDAEVLKYLRGFNDKTMAVDMEADGLGQFCHENGSSPWVVVRGISDLADEQKNDDAQPLAAAHAAIVVRELIPYLVG